MVSETKPFKLLRPRNFDQLRTGFQASGRCQIGSFLPGSKAKKLRRTLEDLPWHLVFNQGHKHVEFNQSEQASLTPELHAAIADAARQRSQSEFQYFYENYPVYDILNGPNPIDRLLEQIYATMNSPETLQMLKALTGETADFCDMQATRYSAGHFLTEHHDDVIGKNRKLAYVINLSQSWKSEWGGTLQFVDDDGAVVDEFLPRFNSLSIFKVPVMHRVSAVVDTVSENRLSLTGWFRTRAGDEI
ncbi:MAG: Uncharacterised protein [Hyphomonas sp. TMED17]|nr:MAG: hypothetical protein CBB77_02945 [Hyphomonas sp. TMED17]CAI8340406.1 MAG: Uncharacterised protein [Hyphomonas sp. TMED17]